VAVERSAGVVVNQLLQRHLHRRLEHAGALDGAAHAEEFRPAVLFGAKRRKPLRAAGHHQRHVAERLDVVDRGRALPRALDRREWRLESRLRALAFERLEQRGFLARLVGAGAAMQVDLAVETRTLDVLSDEAGLPGIVDGLLHGREQVLELTANVDVGGFRSNRVAANHAPLDEHVGIALHQEVILEGTRLALVGVADDELGLRRFLVDELPLEAGREAGAAAAAQP
jgi:hypothetical protein